MRKKRIPRYWWPQGFRENWTGRLDTDLDRMWASVVTGIGFKDWRYPRYCVDQEVTK